MTLKRAFLRNIYREKCRKKNRRKSECYYTNSRRWGDASLKQGRPFAADDVFGATYQYITCRRRPSQHRNQKQSGKHPIVYIHTTDPITSPERKKLEFKHICRLYIFPIPLVYIYILYARWKCLWAFSFSATRPSVHYYTVVVESITYKKRSLLD